MWTNLIIFIEPRIQQHKDSKQKLQNRKWELEWQIKDQKVELADLTTVARYAEELRDMLDGSSLTERKTFIKSFVKSIEVKDNDATLTYTIPILPKETNKEVLSIVQYGGPLWTRTTDPGLIRTVL